MYMVVYFRKYHFGETDDFSAVARLLQVYESYDAAAAAEVVKLPTFRNLETEVSKSDLNSANISPSTLPIS